MILGDNQLAEVVRRSVSETFEGMAFIVITPETETKSSDMLGADEWVWASVDVKEPVSANFTLILSVIFATEIVEVLFGEANGAAEEEQQNKLADVLKEIVNTMVGRCMNKLVSEKQAFSLGLPKFGNGWPEAEGAKMYRFATDEGKPLAAMVELPDGVLAPAEPHGA